MLFWAFRVNMHQPTVRYIHICVYQKKKLLEGSLGVCFYKDLSYRDYLQRGVKTGMNYPYTCVVTCIRLIKIPLWPTIVAENKDFCQFYLPFWVTFPRLTSKRPAENDWLLQCQLRGKINNNPCLHPLKYIFELNSGMIVEIKKRAEKSIKGIGISFWFKWKKAEISF